MKTKFTSGEWKVNGKPIWCEVSDEDTESFKCIDVACGNANLALIPTDMFGQEQSEANAKLIAAAPEMFYLLQKAKDIIYIKTEEFNLVREIESVLKKATE